MVPKKVGPPEVLEGRASLLPGIRVEGRDGDAFLVVEALEAEVDVSGSFRNAGLLVDQAIDEEEGGVL